MTIFFLFLVIMAKNTKPAEIFLCPKFRMLKQDALKIKMCIFFFFSYCVMMFGETNDQVLMGLLDR